MKLNKDKIKHNKKEQRKQELRNAWQDFKKEVGGLDSFGKKTSNAGFQIVKSLFSISICIIILIIALSLLKGD